MKTLSTTVHLRDRTGHEMGAYPSNVVPRKGESVSIQYWEAVVLGVEHRCHSETEAHVFLDVDWKEQMETGDTTNDWTEGRRCRIMSKLK